MTIVRRPSSNNLAHAVIAQVLLVTSSENDGMYVCASVPAFILLCTCVVAFSEKFTALISTQPLVGNQAYIPHIKAIYVPFHMIYGRLMIF